MERLRRLYKTMQLKRINDDIKFFFFIKTYYFSVDVNHPTADSLSQVGKSATFFTMIEVRRSVLSLNDIIVKL